MNNEIERPFSPDEIPDWFWEIIHRATKDEDKLRAILWEFNKDGIRHFEEVFEDAVTEIAERLTQKVKNLYVSDDGLEDMSYWTVSQGKEYYVRAWQDPEIVPQNITGLPFFLRTGYTVYWEKFGEDLILWQSHIDER